MNRKFIEKLDSWAKSPLRKPLVLSGARQVGKTWLLQEFGRARYAKTAYVNFERHPELAALFAGAFDFKRILTGLQAASGVTITPGDTLVILDEIQLCGAALTGLKYWNEEHNDYVVAAAGSLVGLSLLEGTGYPVGKTNSMTLYPMCFGEFLEAVGEDRLLDVVQSGDATLVNAFASKLTELLKTYFLVGGMPAAVAAYAKTLSLDAARTVQREILSDYRRDFAKHAPKAQLPRIRAIWDALPRQLAKEDKRFVAAEVEVVPGAKARARDLHDPFEWLEAAGVVSRIWNVTKPSLPLASYRNHMFKLFGLDVGLLAAQSRLSPKAVLDGSRVFTEFKGALTEQFVQQELRVAGGEPYTWAPSDSRAEIDFLVEGVRDVIPVEAKAERNLQAKSLAVYRAKFAPPIAVRTSLVDARCADGLFDIPLYAFGANITKLMERESAT